MLLLQETKLRNLKQGFEETTADYYYDVLILFRSADPAMVEAYQTRSPVSRVLGRKDLFSVPS